MSRTYTLNAIALYGGRTTNRDMYMSTMQPWADGKRAGCWRSGSTDYYGAVSFIFNSGDLATIRGHTIESIKLSVDCTSTFAYSEELIYDEKSVQSETSWQIPSYAHEVTVPRHGVIPVIDVTAIGVPDYGYVIGGYYKTYAYADVTGGTLTVITAETSKTITYDANGGTNAPEPTVVWGEGSWYGIVSAVQPTRTGYSFAGWNTRANGSGASYASADSITISANITLYAQWTALSSVLNSASNANITEKTTVQWTNYGSFTNKLRFIFGSVDSGEIAVSGTSYQYTLPSSWYAQIPTSTSGTATVYLYTYVNGTLVGTSSRTFTAYVKSSVVPSINNPTATGVNLKWNLYLQKFSSVIIGVTGGAAGTGATIKSYSITGPGLTYSVNTTATSVNSTSAVLTTSGTATYTVKITDSRNRMAQKTVSITVTAYTEPAISSVIGVRCNSDGTVNQTTGTSIKATSVFTWTAVGQNSLTRTLSYKKNNGSSYTTAQTGINSGTSYVIAVGLAEISSSYDVKVEISDSLGNSASYVVVVPPVVGIAFGLKNDRARFGGPVEKAGLQVDWNAEFNGVLDVTRRRCFFTVPSSSAGWYRVFHYNVTTETSLAQMGGCVVKININANRSQENHTIVLRPYSSSAPMFVEEFSSGATANVKKIRYIKKTDNSGGFIDIYFANSGSTQVGVAFDVYTSTLERHSQFAAINTAIEQRLVDDSPSDETLLVEYTFSTNGIGDLNVNGSVAGKGFADLLFGVGTLIPKNTDCNTLLTEGKYTCPSVAVCDTLSNAPFTSIAFGMFVFRVAAVERFIQAAVQSSTNFVIKLREYNGTSWTSWKTLTPS